MVRAQLTAGRRSVWALGRLVFFVVFAASCVDSPVPTENGTIVAGEPPRPSLGATATDAYFEVDIRGAGIVASNGYYVLGTDSVILRTGGQQSGSAAHNYGPAIGTYTLSGSIGGQTASVDLSAADAMNNSKIQSPYGASQEVTFSGSVKAYVLGPTGTKYSVTHSVACQTAVVLATAGVGTYGANAQPCYVASIGPQNPVPPQSIATTVTDSGFSGTEIHPPGGQVYSYVGTYSTVGGVGIRTGINPALATGNASAHVALSVTVRSGASQQHPPAAVIAGPDSASVGLPATFDGSGSTDSDGTIVGYRWEIANASGVDTFTTPTVAYTWSAAGMYPVTLTVTDNDSLRNSTQLAVTVVDPSACSPSLSSVAGIGTATACTRHVRIRLLSQAPLAPANTNSGGTQSSSLSVEVGVYDVQNKPIPNENVNLTLEPVDGSGGHIFARVVDDKGNLRIYHDLKARPAGKILSSVPTGPTGVDTIDYSAPEVAGEVKIVGTSPSAASDSKTIHIRLLGLIEIFAKPGRLTRDKITSHHTSIFKATKLATALAYATATIYQQNYKDVLKVNAASTPGGGRNDVKGNWGTPHDTHRSGTDVDFNPMDGDRLDVIAAGQAAGFRTCVEHFNDNDRTTNKKHVHCSL